MLKVLFVYIKIYRNRMQKIYAIRSLKKRREKHKFILENEY